MATAAITSDTQLSALPKTEEISQNLLHLLQFPGNKAEAIKSLSSVEPIKLKEALEDLCQKLTSSEDPLKDIEQVAELLSLQKLQEAVQIDPSHPVDALKTAQEMFESAKCFLANSEKTLTPSLRARLNA